jgi:hypothetical protein
MKTCITTIVAGIITAASVHAQVLVDWGGSTGYVTANTTITAPNNLAYFNVGTAPSATRTAVYAYVSGTSSVPAGGYSTPSGKSGVFYTGSYMTSSGSTVSVATNRQWIRSVTDGGVGSDSISFVRGGTPGIALDGFTFTAFQKEDFLNGGSSQSNISLGSGSLLTMSLSASVGARAYFAVLNGSQWYVSQTSFTGNATHSLSGTALQSAGWGLWNPTGGANSRLGDLPVSFDVATAGLTNISGFGIVSSNQATAGSSTSLGIGAFTVTAIPEPSTLLSLLVAGLGWIVVSRGKKASSPLR